MLAIDIMFTIDLALAVAITAAFFKSRIVLSNTAGILGLLVGLYLLSFGLEYMGLGWAGAALFVMASINFLLGLFLRARKVSNSH